MRRSLVLHDSRICADGWLLWLVFVFGALVLALALSSTPAAATAYISLTGNFANAGDQHDFLFDLSRPVGSSEVLLFQTFASGGGPNAAGDFIVVTPTGIDSVVQMFDSLNVSRGVNDDYDIANHARDSLLSWTGFTPNPGGLNTPLNPDPLPTDSYRLNLSEFGNDAPGQWALDLLGPEDAIVFRSDSPVGASAISTLKAGNGAQVSFSGSYELNGGKSVTFQSGADFTVADYLDIGNTTAGSLIVKNPGTTLTTNTVSTTFLDWGLDGGAAIVTLSDHATANIQAGYINITADPSSFGLVTVESGADLTINGLYLASSGGVGQVDVRGAGSTLTQNLGSTLSIGSMSGVGLLTIYDSAVFTSGTGQITVNPTGHIRVNDATFNANGSLTVAATGAGSQNGVILENHGQINSRDVFVGSNASSGSVLVNGYTPTIGLPATWNVTGSMSVGSATHSSATVEQAGRLTISDDLTVACPEEGGGCTLTVQTGGQVTVGDTLSIGHWSEVILLGGKINTRSFIVPPLYFPQTPGQFTHEDGTLTVDGGSFYIGTGGLYIDSDTGSGMPTIKLENYATGSVRASPGYADGFVDVGWKGHGRLEVLRGASLTSNKGSIASSGQNFPNSNGHVLVQGDDSLWQITGNEFGTSWLYPLVVGESGAGTLEIRAGGHVVSEGHVLIGSPGGAMNGRGTAIVDGPDALLRVIDDDLGSAAQLSVGVLGPSLARGALTVSNSGRVEVEGELIVEDAGSVTLTSDGEIHAGSFAVHAPGTFTHEDGTLTVDGGTFDPSVAGHTIDGPTAADLPTIKLINGANWTLSGPAVIVVGRNYRGRLELRSGADVTFTGSGGELFINQLAPGRDSQVLVTGEGSSISGVANAFVGWGGQASLSILDHAHVSNVTGGVGIYSGGDGHVTVDGTGSQWTNSSWLAVGYWGKGELEVSNGGYVSSSAGYVGREPGGRGTVTVHNPDSQWNVSGPLHVGGESQGGGPGGTGTLTVANNGHVTAGSIKVWQPGTVELNNGVIYTLSLELAGGTLQGWGDVVLPEVGSLHNAGLVSPEFSGRTIAVSGNYVQDATGTLAIEIGGTSQFEYGRLEIVVGSASLAGMLDVSFIDLGGGVFAPSAGDEFEILTAAGGLGGTTFDSIIFPDLRGGLLFGVFYNPTDVTLVVGGVLGDYNLNGVVDAADYTVWRNTLGQTGTGLAANGDNTGASAGRIDQADYAVWKTHFGMTAGSGAEASAFSNAGVPEPATWVFLMLASAGVVVWRPRLRCCRHLVAACALACIVSTSSSRAAVTYSAAADFSATENPNSVWRYGWYSSFTSELHVYPTSADNGNLHGWTDPPITVLGAPSVFRNYTSSTYASGTVSILAGQLASHPGNLGQYSVVRWTAPHSGPVEIAAAFSGRDLWGTTTDAHVLHNGASLFDAVVNGFNIGPAPFETSRNVLEGDTVDFVVGYGNGAFWNDTTGIEGVIVLDPAALPTGDYNQNGVVDAADYTVWRDTFGSIIDLRANGDNTGASAGVVDDADYALWKLHFGETAPGSGARAIAGFPGTGEAAVPEPASFLLSVFAAAWMLIHRLARPTAEQGHWKVAIWVALLLLWFPRSPAVLAQCERPTIESQPQSQTVSVGSDVTFLVEVTGTEPLVYQWRKDGAPIPGGIDPSFSIVDVVVAHAGDYAVSSVNQCGAAMSDTASLTVIIAGDYNQNGVVDAADYTVWRNNLGANITLPNEDPTQTPGWVTVDDYTVWKTNFGQHAGAGAGAVASANLDAAVPEPASLALVLIAAALLSNHRAIAAKESR